jgi:hypothetical protein
MSYQKLLQQMIGVTLFLLLLVGCGAPAATPVSEAPAATSTPVPSAATPTPEPPTATPTPIPPTPEPPTATPTPIPPTPEPPTAPPFTVSGTLNYRKQIQVPDNARVVVVWGVTAVSPDYSYVFGEGTIDFENNSFEIEFNGPPPSEALNWVGSSALGVGVLIITTDQTLGTGILLPESFSETDILGASGQYRIIYANGNLETLEKLLGWLNAFNQGYSAGKGIEIPNSIFDGFEPIDPTTIEIIIDDLENIEFVNWQ